MLTTSARRFANQWGRLALILWCGGQVGAFSQPFSQPNTNSAPIIVTATNLASRHLTLAEARSLAFQRNWDLLAARSDVDLSTAQKIVTKEFPNPALAWSMSKMPINSQPAGTEHGNGLWDRSYDTVVSVNQLFEIGGKRHSRQISADHGLKASRARLEDARRLLELGVTKAYIAALQADLNAQTLHDSAASLRREAEIAKVRLQAGDISTADKSQIEILADRFELDAQSSEANALTLRISLENLIGVPKPTGEWTAADGLDTLLGTPSYETEPLTLPVRPDLVAAESSLRKAEADLKLQKALRIPDPTVMLMYEHEPPEASQTIGLGLSFPLPLWNRNRGAIKAAEAVREQAAVQVAKVQGQIAAEIASARAAYREASARHANYQSNIRPKSAEILKTISFAYAKGGASLLDLLSAQRNDNEVRLATVQAAADAAATLATLKATLAKAEETLAKPPPQPK